MIKPLDSVVAAEDYYGAILEVEVRTTPLLTPTHSSRSISQAHFEWLTNKLFLFPSTLVRTGLFTGDRPDHLVLPVPFYPEVTCTFTDSQGWQSDGPKAVLWAPQARATNFQVSNKLPSSPNKEWEIVQEYFFNLCTQKGLSEQLCTDSLSVSGLASHYDALSTGDIELHFDIWDCLATAQAREGQLVERCFDLQKRILSAASPHRIDSLFRTYDPLPPLLFVYVPLPEAKPDPQNLTTILHETIELSGRKVVVTVPAYRSCDLEYWHFLLQLSHELEGIGAALRLRLLPRSLTLTTAKGVPVPVTPHLFVSRFGASTFFDLPLRASLVQKEALKPQELWEQQDTELRGAVSLFELLTEEVYDLN